MNNTSGIYLHSHTALSGTSNSVLKEGGFVSVRVLKNVSPGLYTVAFAGGRFSLKSSIPLQNGETFRARLHIENRTLLLEPVENQNNLNNTFLTVTALGQEEAAVSGLLENLGLVPDELNRKLLTLMMQNGSKIDAALLSKIRRILSKSGNRTGRAELALILEEKGIDAESGILEELLLLSDEDETDSNDFGNPEIVKNASASDEFFPEVEEEIKKFVESVFGCKESGKAGVLTVFNQMHKEGFGENREKFWTIVPFDFQIGEKAGTGGIKLLLNLMKKQPEKTVIDFAFDGKKLRFALYFNGSEIRKFGFAEKGGMNVKDSELRGLCEKLSGKGKKIPEIVREDYDGMSEFGFEDVNLCSVEGFV